MIFWFSQRINVYDILIIQQFPDLEETEMTKTVDNSWEISQNDDQHNQNARKIGMKLRTKTDKNKYKGYENNNIEQNLMKF
jgi:hypothetical protein